MTKKITQLTELTNAVGADLLEIVDDVGGTPASKKITLENLLSSSANQAPTGALDFSGASSLTLGTVSGATTMNADLTLSEDTPRLYLVDTNAPTNEKHWIQSLNAGSWQLSPASEATPTTPTNTAINIQRTGTTVDEIELNATTLDFNGTIHADNLSFDDGTTSQTVFLKGSLVFNGGTVAANSVTTTTTTITGALTTGQTVSVNCNAPIANLKYTAQITATNTVTLYIWNDTAAGIAAGNRTYSFTIIG